MSRVLLGLMSNLVETWQASNMIKRQIRSSLSCNVQLLETAIQLSSEWKTWTDDEVTNIVIQLFNTKLKVSEELAGIMATFLGSTAGCWLWMVTN